MMERKEFLAIRDKLTTVVLEYETMQRKIYFLNNSYYIAFKDLLEQRLYLEYENKYLLEAITKKKENMNGEQIKELLEQNRIQFNSILESFHKKMSTASELEQRCRHYQAADIENLDQEFMDFCMLYHPVIKAHSTVAERNAYSALSMVYRMGNIAGYHNLLEEFKDTFTSTSVLDEEYDTIARLYEESYRNLVALIDKQKNEFPLNKEAIFVDEAAMTNEYAALREKTAQLRDMNKQIHKDFILNYKFDFEL